MQLEDLLWPDWLGLALLAYGLGAGAVRGLTQQFSRLLVWALALAAATSLGLVFAGASGSEVPRFAVGMQAACYLLLGLGLSALQRRLLRHSGAKSLADALLGALFGVALASLPWIVSLSTVGAYTAHGTAVREAELAPVLRQMEQVTAFLPGAGRTSWLELPSASD